MGRFINADASTSTGQGMLGNNMHAYCSNNPIIRKDAEGKAFDTLWDAFSICWGIFEVFSDPSNPDAWTGLALDLFDMFPFVTGTGEAYRAYKISYDLADGFSSLSKAKDYGIMGYKALRKAIKGTGLEAHHIIEKRLVQYLGIDANNMLSVALTKWEHNIFTMAWRAAFPYGMDYSTLTVDDIWDVAQQIYKDYPELLDAAKEILYG
jgi:hypothetical protein